MMPESKPWHDMTRNPALSFYLDRPQMGDYPVVILQAFILFPIVAFLFTLPYVVFNYHKYGSVLSLRIIIVYSFILYLMCIYFLVILPLPSIAEVSAMTGARMQLVPFKFVGDILS